MAVTPQAFGALGNGIVDDGPAIQAAVDSLSFGGTVFIPAGTYNIGNSVKPVPVYGSDPASAFGIYIPSNVRLQGEGSATVLRKHDTITGDGLHPLCFYDGAKDAEVSDLVIDGRWPESGLGIGHGICNNAPETSETRVRIRNVEIRNVGSYGIGLQHGRMARCLIENIWIHDVGADGIDVKNVTDSNVANRMFNVLIERHGLANDHRNLGGLAGVDIRGDGWQVAHVGVYEYGGVTPESVGFRWRGGTSDSSAGKQARFSNLTDLRLDAASNQDTTGLVVNGSRNLSAVGLIRGNDVGVRLQPTSGDVCDYSKVALIDASDSRTWGFLVSSGATNARIYDCHGTVSNNGTGTVIK